MGPSLITMPWVLEETFAAGGLDLHARGRRCGRLDPLLPDPLGGRAATTSTSCAEPERLRARDREVLGRATRRASTAFLAALRPIYEDGHPGRGPPRRSCARATSPRFVPAMVAARAPRCRCTRFVARHFRHPRVREAFSFHSLFIGGDPFRVPAIYAALVYLQVARRRLVRRRRRVRARRGDGAPARRALRRAGASGSSTRGGRVTGVGSAGGERAGRRRRRLQRRRPAHARALLGGRRRPARPPAADDVVLPALPRHATGASTALLHHTLLVGRGYRRFIRDVDARGAAAARRSRPTSTRPSRTEPAMARAGRRLARGAAAGPEPARRVDWEREADGLRDALVADLERTFGLDGLDATRRASSTA